MGWGQSKICRGRKGIGVGRRLAALALQASTGIILLMEKELCIFLSKDLGNEAEARGGAGGGPGCENH